jgi:uncharacterized protein (DUF2147 family)
MKALLLAALVFLTPLYTEAIEGFWRNINPKTGHPKMVVAVYAHEDIYYGRIIASYDQKGELDDTMYNAEGKAAGVKGNPFYAGLDFIWNVKKKGKRYKGKIIDPRNGKIYDVELWRQGDDLIVRGSILFFGRNEIWTKAQESDFTQTFAKPDVKTFIPIIPESICKK